jgi:hypothetical protein
MCRYIFDLDIHINIQFQVHNSNGSFGYCHQTVRYIKFARPPYCCSTFHKNINLTEAARTFQDPILSDARVATIPEAQGSKRKSRNVGWTLVA